MCFNNHEEIGYDLKLDLLTISYYYDVFHILGEVS